jgi:hypothetical protein
MTEPLTAETIAELERIDAEANAAREAYVRNPSDDAKRIRLEQANIALDLWLEVNRTKLLAAARSVAELPDVGEPEVYGDRRVAWRNAAGAWVVLHPDGLINVGSVENRLDALWVAAALLVAAAPGGGR